MLFYQTALIESRRGKKFEDNQYDKFVDDLTSGRIINIGTVCTYPHHNQLLIEALFMDEEEDEYYNQDYRLTPDLELLKFIHQNVEDNMKKKIRHYLAQSDGIREHFNKENNHDIKRWCVGVVFGAG